MIGTSVDTDRGIRRLHRFLRRQYGESYTAGLLRVYFAHPEHPLHRLARIRIDGRETGDVATLFISCGLARLFVP